VRCAWGPFAMQGIRHCQQSETIRKESVFSLRTASLAIRRLDRKGARMSQQLIPAPSAAQPLDIAVEVLAGREIAVLTGAGLSTDSGIPDYRGEGAPVRNPMTFAQYLADEDYRKRYWAGSHLGWKRFAGARPNAGH